MLIYNHAVHADKSFIRLSKQLYLRSFKHDFNRSSFVTTSIILYKGYHMVINLQLSKRLEITDFGDTVKKQIKMRIFVGISILGIKAVNVNSHSGIYDLDGNCE